MANEREPDLDETASTDAVRQALDRLRSLEGEKDLLFRRLAEGERRFRRLARSAWAVQESERRRLARELHDGVGQTLTALKNELELVRRSSGALPRDAAERFDMACELATRALADTREMSRLLRPQILDDLGLEAALGWLCRTLQERSGIVARLDVRIPASHALGSELETLAFRVVQEATNNAEKHSCAARLDVVVEVTHRVLHIGVSDDGEGFDAAAPETYAGTGLGGLRDRLELFGGRLRVSSRPGEGVRLEAEVPRAEEAAT